MTPEQNKVVARVGRELQKAFPNYYGYIRFNMSKERDYVLANFDQNVALEFDGIVIKSLKEARKKAGGDRFFVNSNR